MMDNFREWLSDNLRYILLGLAVLLVVVIAFFAIRLISGGGSSKKDQAETAKPVEQNEGVQTESKNASDDGTASEQTSTETSETSGTSEYPLTKESSDSAVQTLVTQYYTAVAARDYDTLSSIDETFDEEAKAEVEAESAIESYNNIITYTKPGLTDGTYVAYIYFEAKITGIDTMAPSLREMYLVTDEDGILKIGDKRSSQELINYLLDCQRDNDVQSLVKDVNQKLETAKEQDSDLASYVDSINTVSDQADSGSDNSGTQTGTMKVSTGVNVRGEASSDAVLYGTLTAGMEVEVLENLDNGWSKIRYTYSGTTIEGYIMTQYLEPADE